MKKLFSPFLIALMLCASISAQTDSLASLNKPLESYSPSAGTIIGEVFLGPVSGAICAIPMALLFSGASDQNSKNDKWDNVAWGAIGVGAGYIIGTGLGVYLFAHHDNPEVTFGGTVLGSVLGTGVGIGLAALINKGDSAIPYVVGLSCPLIGSMVYANFVAPHPKSSGYSANIDNYRSIALSYSHKDLYNSTLQYRMNLFTVAF
ncbi:MAG: hypothetical protein HF309_18275 [Ignavibacteria bacterium]|jgi:hypothetical protein|nr:hypothetical protein [Ignavibacteria bacterium]MCU7501226.1 hypothetical protein [Ignavibacteria bacterium]MCU7520683.1 hypothetical protein [Ignavibacteria bacterium]HEX2962490.1 hypothetical protein [Ignavibacteriales bacterium]